MSTSPGGSFDGGDGDDANFQGAGTSDGDDSPETVTESAVNWDTLAGIPRSLRKLAEEPKTFILGTVVSWLVATFIITPTKYVLAFIDWGFASVADAIGISQDSVARGLAPAAEAILSIPVDLFTALSEAVQRMGLAAPLATTIVASLFVFVFTTIVIMLGRAAADVVPGLGGLIR